MKTRRDFLKVLLGAALVAPAVVACRTVVPEPFDLPAEIDAESMWADRFFRDEIWIETEVVNGDLVICGRGKQSTWSSSGVQPQNFQRWTLSDPQRWIQCPGSVKS